MPDANQRSLDNSPPGNSRERIKQYLTTIGPCKYLTYTTSLQREAIIITDHGIVLNQFLPLSFFIQNNPDVPLLDAEWQNNLLLINLDQALHNKRMGRAILAHEFGHIFAGDETLVKESGKLGTRLVFKDVPQSSEEKVESINRIAEITIALELHAWDNAAELAEFLAVEPSNFELTRKLGLDGHFYNVLRKQLSGLELFIGNVHPDSVFSIFDPFQGRRIEIRYDELQEKVLDSEKERQATYQEAQRLSQE